MSGGRGRPGWRVALVAAALLVLASFALALAVRQFGGRRGRRIGDLLLGTVRLRTAVCLCRSDDEITLGRSDGVRLAGSLYGAGESPDLPALLLLHGNTPLGRRLALYEILATRLARRGYRVLSIDAAGYGQSDHPFTGDDRGPPRPEADVETAIAYLRAASGGGGRGVVLVAHSGGVTAALPVLATNDAVLGLAAIGPPRRTLARLNQPGGRDYFWQRARETHRTVYGAPLPGWYTQEVWLQGLLDRALERYSDDFAAAGHKPLLLVDGALEKRENLEFLAAYYEAMSEPKRYVTLPAAGHYANSEGLFGLNVYDRSVMKRLVDIIDRWIREAVSAGLPAGAFQDAAAPPAAMPAASTASPSR